MRNALLLLLCSMLVSCDYAETTVNTGQEAADSARVVVAGDSDRQIEQARELIRLGKIDDARRMLQAIEEQSAALSESTKAKLETALEELESASR